MKKLFVSSITILMLFTLTSCNKETTTNNPSSNTITETPAVTTNVDNSTTSQLDSEKILIAYFSRVGTSESFDDIDAVSSASLPTGNTIVLANMIHEAIGGDMFQIVTVNPYPAIYNETTALASEEQKQGARPKLSTHIKNMDSYDTVFIGFPNWWGTIPQPLFTFFEEYDFSNKKIIPFVTHEGSSFGRSLNDLASLCPDSIILDGLSVRGRNVDTSNKDVEKWLKDIGFID